MQKEILTESHKESEMKDNSVYFLKSLLFHGFFSFLQTRKRKKEILIYPAGHVRSKSPTKSIKEKEEQEEEEELTVAARGSLLGNALGIKWGLTWSTGELMRGRED